jgi:hypothetical protein
MLSIKISIYFAIKNVANLLGATEQHFIFLACLSHNWYICYYCNCHCNMLNVKWHKTGSISSVSITVYIADNINENNILVKQLAGELYGSALNRICPDALTPLLHIVSVEAAANLHWRPIWTCR